MDIISEHGYRQDGRQASQLRAFSCKMGVYAQADGSAYVQMGNTKVLCAVYGPHEAKYKSKLEENKALVNCQYSMATFSTMERKQRPRGDRKSQEFTMHLQKAFNSVICTEHYARSQIDIFCEILQADGSNLAACINAGCLALCDAGIQIKGIVAACQSACVTISNQNEPSNIVDLCHAEEGGGNARCTCALLPKDEQLMLMELDSRLHIDHLDALLEAAFTACRQVHLVMVAAVQQHVGDTADKLGWLKE